MKCFEIQFSELANTMLCSSYQFHKLEKEIKNRHNILTARARSYCEILSGYAFSSEDYDTDGVKLVRIGDFDNQGLSLDECAYLPKDFQNKFEKFLLKEGDILIAMTGATIGKSALVEELNEKLLLNQRVGALRAKDGVNSRFFSYLIKCDFFRKQVVLASMGKSQSNISPFDILNIKIPEISKSAQDHIVAQIEPIECKIKDLKNQIKKPQEVINQVFAREFGFDLEGFEEVRKQKFFEFDFSDFSKHRDLRCGIGTKKASIELKPFISKDFEFVRLGEIISLEYGSGLTDQERVEGDYPVMGSNGIVGYHNNFLIKSPSIIVGRKGSAGEINYIEENCYPIDTCFYVKFLKQQNVIYFSYLLKFLQLKRLTLFKGVPGLNRYDVYEVKVPRLLPMHQQKIVDEIKLELDSQELIKKQIESERQKIDAIIEQAISLRG